MLMQRRRTDAPGLLMRDVCMYHCTLLPHAAHSWRGLMLRRAVSLSSDATVSSPATTG